MMFVSLAQDLVPWETDPDTGDQYIEIPQVCGAGWWGALEGVVGSITCESCRTDAVKMLSAMHDLVNVRLGKGLYDPSNFSEVVQQYQAALERTFHLQTAHAGQDSPFASLAQLVDPAPGQAMDGQDDYSPGNNSADMGFFGTIVNGVGLGLGFAVSNFLVSRSRAVAEAHQDKKDFCYLSPDVIELDIAGSGKFVREVIAESSGFDPDSLRTVEADEHRVLVACPKGEWMPSGAQDERCSTKMKGLQILHPRAEETDLLLQAISRGIPVVGDGPMEAMAEMIEDLERQEASGVEA